MSQHTCTKRYEAPQVYAITTDHLTVCLITFNTEENGPRLLNIVMYSIKKASDECLRHKNGSYNSSTHKIWHCMTSQQTKRCEGVQVHISKSATVFGIGLKTE